MNAGQLIFLVALAFTCALSSFIYAARQKGWPYGGIFESGRIPSMVSLGCLAFLGGKLIFALMAGELGLIWLLWSALAYFLGGMLLMAALRGLTGIVALVSAPALAVGSIFLKF